MPGTSTLRYGGNTSCVEVAAEDGTLVVLDCGTGAHALGASLVRRGAAARRGHLLIGHTHWDHIQGFPFFSPLFDEGATWDVYAPGGKDRQLERTLAGQMTYEYSPISLEALRAECRFHDLEEGVFDAGGIRITTQYLNHPALTLGYRLEADGAVLAYSTDHEPYSLHPRNAPAGAPPVHHEDRRHVSFLEGADVVIHDGQYTLADFPAKAGWGHSPVERVVDYVLGAGAGRLVFSHHDPARDDRAVDEVLEIARRRADSADARLDVQAAAEGCEIELSGARPRGRPPIEPAASAHVSETPQRAHTVLVVDDDPDMVALVGEALRTDGARVLTATDGDAALSIARRERPSLIVLDVRLPGRDGLDVCRALRAERDPRLANIPILLITGTKLGESDLVETFVAGASDYLTKPIKPSLVRSRVRGWLMRAAD